MNLEAHLADILDAYVPLAEKPPCARCTPGMAPLALSGTEAGQVLHPEWDKWCRANIGKDNVEDMDATPEGVPKWVTCPDCDGRRFMPTKLWAATLTKLIEQLRQETP